MRDRARVPSDSVADTQCPRAPPNARTAHVTGGRGKSPHGANPRALLAPFIVNQHSGDPEEQARSGAEDRNREELPAPREPRNRLAETPLQALAPATPLPCVPAESPISPIPAGTHTLTGQGLESEHSREGMCLAAADLGSTPVGPQE